MTGRSQTQQNQSVSAIDSSDRHPSSSTNCPINWRRPIAPRPGGHIKSEKVSSGKHDTMTLRMATTSRHKMIQNVNKICSNQTNHI